jgi:hypothetical protein
VRHRHEQLRRRRRRQGRVELTVGGDHVGGQALGVAPVGEIRDVDVGGGRGRVHPGLEALAGSGPDVAQIPPDVLDAGGVGHRAVAGDEHRGAQVEDPVARGNPVAQARPHDRRALDEQEVTGEHDAGVGNVDDRVTAGMRRPQLDERHAAVTDLEIHPAGEGLRRVAHRDALEVERAERVLDEIGELRWHPRRRLQRVQQLGRQLLHLGGARRRRVDLGSRRKQLVAEAVIGIGVRVDRGIDRVPGGDRGHRAQHLARQVQVVEGVDEQRGAVGGDEPGVAPAPAAVGLEVGVQPIAELVEPAGVGDLRQAAIPPQAAAHRPAGWRGSASPTRPSRPPG